MKTASINGVIFNCSKCHISQPQISFYSAIFTVQGMKSDPTKNETFKTSLHHRIWKNYSHFGINKLSSAISARPCSQDHISLWQVSNWDWTSPTDTSFHHLKQWICNTLLKTTLTYCNQTKPVDTYRCQQIQIGSTPYTEQPPDSLCFQDPDRHRNLICQHWTWVLISYFWTRKIRYIHIWMPHYSFQWL